MIFVPLITFFGTIFVYEKFIDKTIPTVEELKEEKKKNNYSDKDDKKDISNYVNELPSLRAQYGNNDIFGKLEITPLNINTMVMRSVNNSYYLDRNIYKQVDGLGVPFFDYRNQDLANNRQINIYGHNTQNVNFLSQLPFVNLTAYADKNIFDNYKSVYLSIDEKQIEYEVIAVKIIKDGNNEHMKLIFYSDDDFVNHAAKMINGSIYAHNQTVTKDDKLLVLQVCYYDPPGSYLIVICKEKK
jgi:SrtB family sortase